ncbi:MAG: alkaline phosphatase family protein [Xanthobacteraceae bacterium]
MLNLRTILAVSALAVVATSAAAQQTPHNVILFVPDGLRALKVTPETAPAMAALRDRGVNFKNPHSLFPTFTMPNSSGLSTGHQLGDTGVFSNTIFSGYATAPAAGSVTPFLENDAVLGDIDQHFSKNYVNEDTILKAARDQGYSTAAIGKVGPTLMFDHTERTGSKTIIVDDQTGTPAGIPLSDEVKTSMQAAGLSLTAPTRGDNGKAGDFKTAGTTVANVTQQAWLTDVAAKAVLPLLKARNKPFVLVLWSRDPDGTQHNQGDSFNSLTPGINGPTSLAAIKNADDNLAHLQQSLKDLGLAETTNIVIAADHGFSTISKESKTSSATSGEFADVIKGQLPPGFVALDLAKALDLPLFDPDSKNAAVGANAYPRAGNALIGKDVTKPDLVVAANGGSDLIYIPNKDKKFAARAVAALLEQDYVSGLFVDDSLGRFPGTLPLSTINLKGSAITPQPAIVVNFRSFSTGCDEPLLCSVSVADTRLQQGQGMHGNFNRADTMNFMAAAGPDFKQGYIDEVPVSNADIGKTIARIMGLKLSDHGKLVGRVMTEAMPNGPRPKVIARTLRSAPGSSGLRTVLISKVVGATRYFDVAGFPGRTVGLDAGMTASR